MSDDKKENNVVNLLDRLKKNDPGHPIIPEEVMSVMEDLLKPDDLTGFLRVIEVLRTIGNEVQINASIIDLCLKVTQHPSEELDLEDGAVQKKTEASQVITLDFAFLPEYDEETDEFHEIDFDEYVNTITPTLRKGIVSLMYWHDGKGNKDDKSKE